MPDSKPDAVGAAQRRQVALSRWDNEGGAGTDSPQERVTSGEDYSDIPEFTHTELVRLRMRVIALENLVMALFAEASDRQNDLAREMATYISPRPGFTTHPLTINAANQMIHLVERASQFRERPPAAIPYERTAVFNEDTLPAGLRREHRTKPGVWGVIRVLDGRVRYRVLDPVSELILEPGHPGLVRPDQPHFVEPLGSVRIQIEFYSQLPDL
jgi:tellurite resistance-related uncharacterized protein